MAAERHLSWRELNRALLARQGLLEPGDGPLPEVLERIGGLQAQYAPSMYVGLWSRVRGLERDGLTRALERREIVQATLMRVTIHLVSARDYWPFAVATRNARRKLWLRSTRGAHSPQEMEAAAETLKARLADGPVGPKELRTLVGKERAGGVGLWIDLVRVPPAGTWERRRADSYGAAEDWLGPPGVAPGDAVEHLVRAYLRGFGPASRADLASWAGLPASELAPALARLELRRFAGETGDELLDLPGAPLPDPETEAPVRFLPTWDATLLVQARRTRILPEEHRAAIFSTRNPHSLPTFLVDGAVAGTWRYEKGRIDLGPFGRLDAGTRRALAGEAARLAEFHA